MKDMFFKPRMKNTAKAVVRLAQKYNDKDNPMGYFYVLNGFGFCRLAAFEGEPHDYKLAIDEIHNYQAKHPRKNVQEGYRKAFSYSIRLIHDKETLHNVINYLDYEFEKQKNGTAAFRLDFEGIIEELRIRLQNDPNNLKRLYSNYDRMICEVIEELKRKSWERG